ncbi:25552_t:CDS:2, partial [Gigaspora rosea]
MLTSEVSWELYIENFEKTAGSNPYTNYKQLQGNFGYSRNICALALYYGEFGAFLDSNEFTSNWYHPTLYNAVNWLKKTISRQQTNEINHTTRQQNPRDIVVPNYNIDPETHNEDFNYQYLMAGFMLPLNSNMRIPISLGNQNNCTVIKRKHPILIRTTYLTIKNGEKYFYQQLLLNYAFCSENEIKSNYLTYQDHLIARSAEQYNIINQTENQHNSTYSLKMINAYEEMIADLIHTIPQVNIANLCNIQLLNLYKAPTHFSESSPLCLPHDQYIVLNKLNSTL